jgi:hypothetical protein
MLKTIASLFVAALTACSFSAAADSNELDSGLDVEAKPPAQPESSTVVFRPGDPWGPHDNVFCSWNSAYTALQRMRGRGRVTLEFDDTFISPIVIPAGRWEMNSGDVHWDSYNNKPTCTVELADGAQIAIDAPAYALPGWQRVLTLVGTNLRIVSNRIGSVAPFVGVSFVLVGNRVRLINTSPLAKPMIEVQGPNNFIAIAGNVALGGIGDSVALPAPLVDLRGGSLIVAGGGGYVSDNAFTDSVGGGAVNMRVMSDSFGGGNNAQSHSFPGMVAGGAALNYSIETRDRFRVFNIVVASSTLTSYSATYNEMVLVNASAAAIVVRAPKSSKGDRFAVKDVAGGGGIEVVPSSESEIVEAGTIDPGQAKTWISDGHGAWWLVSATPPRTLSP